MWISATPFILSSIIFLIDTIFILEQIIEYRFGAFMTLKNRG